MSRLKEEEFSRLEQQIKQWNIDHFDLFELSQPNENLEFFGVIRFYFQDEGQKVSTKCVRVSSTASTQEVVDVLVEKFRPDMRMLTPTSYSLYEVHVNGEERKLVQGEKPLLVQLNWGKDVREGRFLLKRDSDATIPKEQEVFEIEGQTSGMKRKLSKREKKEKKKREKDRIRNKENFSYDSKPGDTNVAEKHYNELPETSFTRSISNPEAVMRRRRQQKLEKKLEQIRTQGTNSAGTLKIYGESLKPDVPYKTLLLSSSDPVWYVIKETLEKYGMEKENPKEYCLVQVSVAYDEREYHGGKMGDERRLDLDECPLDIAMKHPPSKGTLMFEIRRKTVDEKRKAKALKAVSHEELRYSEDHSKKSPEKLPYLQQLFPDGSDNPRGRRHRLQVDVTEVGSDEHALGDSQAIVIPDRAIQPRHCVLAHTDGGIVTVTPNSQEAETYVNNMRIDETTILKNGMTVAFGRNNLFRFIQPNEHERQQQKAQFAEDIAALQKKAKFDDRPPNRKQSPNFNETTFDLDGHVETRSQGQFDRPPLIEDMQTRSMSQKDLNMSEQPGLLEDALPVALEFREDGEDNFLASLISDVNGVNVSFKLAPTYTVYMAVRYRLSMMYRPDMSPSERAHRLTSLINKVASLLQQAIQDQHDNPAAMSFWMANASELLHFCKQDHDVHPFSQDAQEVLAESVQIAFHHLVRCLQQDLQNVMIAFLDESDDLDDDEFMNEDTLTRRYKGRPVLSDVLNTLSSAMHLLRRCRVNAALTIQLFSQLFHFINMSLFNTLVTQLQMRLCTMKWGIRLKRRLGRVEAWAEKQGLELAADCHLCRIIQAAHLLQAPKSSPDHIAYISSTCFKLNSLQLRTLLEKYIPEPGEPPIPQTLIEKVVAVAENMADELTRTDGRDIQLEEDPDLQLPFLLPEDGYSCDIIRGVPNGLLEFLEPLSRSGLCRAMVQQEAVGDWTVYMVPTDENKFMENVPSKGGPPGQTKPHSPAPGHVPQGRDPEHLRVTFSKVNGSMGLSIVAAKGETQKDSGIYIKSVVTGGAAALDGRLAAGDQLLEVDGKNLIGLSQEKAAELMTRTGHTVSLKVAKQGAIYHGLAKLLSQPSPILQQRGMQRGPGSPGQKFQNSPPHEEAPPPYFNGVKEGRGEPGMVSGKYRPGLQQSQLARSSPSLNSDISNSDRQRATSTSNVRDMRDDRPTQNQHPPNLYKQPVVQEIDSRSKSTSNLSQPDPHGRHDPQQIRPAASTSVLPRNQQPRDYRAEGPSGDPRGYDPRSRLDPRQQQYPQNGNHNVNYENQPRMDPQHQKNQPPNRRHDNNNSPNYSRTSNESGNKWSPPHQGQPNKRTSSSSSSSLQRDENRPRSAYITQPDRPEFHQARPKSEEVELNRVREWQERNERSNIKPQLSPNSNRPGPPYGHQPPQEQNPQRTAPYNQVQGGYYENTSPHPQGEPPEDRLDHPSAKPKPAVTHKSAPSRAVQHIEVNRSQVPTWKNSLPRPEKKISHVAVPRSQLDSNRQQRSPQEHQRGEIHRPDNRTDPRSSQRLVHPQDQKTAPRPDQRQEIRPDQRNEYRPDQRQDLRTEQRSDPRVEQRLSQHIDPRAEQRLSQQIDPRADQRLSQHIDPRADQRLSQHIDPRADQRLSQHIDPRQQPSYPSPSSQSPHIPNSQMPYYDSQPNRYQTNTERYGQPVNHELPPPPDNPPELPPPPAEIEELPPPPPPPVADYRLEQTIREEQERLMQQLNNSHSVDPYRDQYRGGSEVDPRYPNPQFDGSEYNPNNYSPHVQNPDPYTAQPNYQNINRFHDDQPERSPYDQREPAVTQPLGQSNVHPRYNQLDHVRQPSPHQDPVSIRNDISAQRKPPVAIKPKNTNLRADHGEKPGVATSAWDRDQKEKEMKQKEMTVKQMRDYEIAELEGKLPYLSLPEEDRLKKLRLDQEFQRRVEEVDERGDDDDDDSDNEVSERLLQREQLIQNVQDDLLKTKLRLEEMHQRRRYEDYEREKDRMERLQRKLEIFELEREEQKSRQKKRQETREKKQTEYLQKQREMRERQRREFEENKRMLMQEEEKMRQRKMEEAKRKRDLEREQMREMQEARDAEEAALRAEARKQEEEFNRQRQVQLELEREQQRQLRAKEEQKRMEALAKQNLTPTPYHPPHSTNQFQSYQAPQQNYSYQPPQPSNLAPHLNNNHMDSGMLNAPPPPQRKSSYEYVQHHQQQSIRPQDMPSGDPANYMNSSAYRGPPLNNSSLRGQPEGNGPGITKKSVSFNTQLETQIQYSVSSEDDPSRHTSYRSSSSSQEPQSPLDSSHYSYGGPTSAVVPNDVFQTPPQQIGTNNVSYKVSDTPGVVGAQEVYRDPRSRIQAKKAQQPLKGTGTERMSFRDKMKFFAKEAGENTPTEKPKASRVQRTIESQMNGQ